LLCALYVKAKQHLELINLIITFHQYPSIMSPDISGRFPYPVLTPFPDGTPTYQTLCLLHKEQNSNAMAIPSRRGDGIQGHYALVVSEATYLTESGNIPFIPPRNPGAEPVPQVGSDKIYSRLNQAWTPSFSYLIPLVVILEIHV
jgi:hypothetical protein